MGFEVDSNVTYMSKRDSYGDVILSIWLELNVLTGGCRKSIEISVNF